MKLLQFLYKVLYVNYMANRAAYTGQQPSKKEKELYL